MRKHLVPILAACAAFNSTVWALKPGDALTPDALGKAEVIQGEVPKAWEPGKLYMLECWATWCHPCVAAIPHTDALYDKFKDQGLVVVGVDIWEDDKTKAAELVKNKGEGMSYPVIHTGRKGSSAFDKEWLKPGGVSAIPYAFLVKDGKLLFGIHPGRLTEDAIEGLLAGGEKQDAVVKFYMDEITKNAVMQLMMDFQWADNAKDADAMAAKLAELEKLDPTERSLPTLLLRLDFAKKDWAGLAQRIQSLPAEQASAVMMFHWAVRLDAEPEASEAVSKAFLDRLLKTPGIAERPMSDVLISRFQWRTGDKDAAIASANKAVGNADVREAVIYVAFANSLATDKPQTFKDVEAALSGMSRNGRR